jgi:molybdenum cofactor synthesis domain-containing protein
MVARPGPARYAFTRGICYGYPRTCPKKGLGRAYFDGKTGGLPVTATGVLGENAAGGFGYLGRTGTRRRGEVMSDIVTAGILVIGDEILSGRTKDKNIGFIAEYLTNIGIDLKEVRVVADEEADIVAALNALRHRYTYVFTTGGIGPTHDDITADSVAKAFGVGIDHHPEVVARFKERWTEQDLNEARLRMARVPDGAELIQSATILAPGFKLGNVIVMAGIPTIMQAMMDIVAPKLKSGVRMLSDSVRANAREGDIGGPLRAIANAHPDTIIGSYPFQDEDKKPNTNLVVRSRDPEKLNAAMTAVKEMLAGLNLAR